jgi:hypothetical protein
MSDENFDRVIYDLSSKVNEFSNMKTENISFLNFSNIKSTFLNKKILYYILPNILLLIILLILKPRFLIYQDKQNKKYYRIYLILFIFILINILLYYFNYKFMLV